MQKGNKVLNMGLNFVAALICDASSTGKASEVIRNHGCISLIVHTDDRGVVHIGTYNDTYLVRYSSRLGSCARLFDFPLPQDSHGFLVADLIAAPCTCLLSTVLFMSLVFRCASLSCHSIIGALAMLVLPFVVIWAARSMDDDVHIALSLRLSVQSVWYSHSCTLCKHSSSRILLRLHRPTLEWTLADQLDRVHEGVLQRQLLANFSFTSNACLHVFTTG